jgi:hypothetical protein
MSAAGNHCRGSIRGGKSSTGCCWRNEDKPARERLALIRIFEELRGLGYRAATIRFGAMPRPGGWRAGAGLCSLAEPVVDTTSDLAELVLAMLGCS